MTLLQFIVAIISLAIAASLAELCSAWPHSAGQAMWAYNLAPPKWAPFLSFWTAWLNIAVSLGACESSGGKNCC